MSDTFKPNKLSGLQIINAVFFILNLAAFIFGLGHESSEARLFGRYSYGYAGFLIGLGAIILLQMWLWCCASERMLKAAGNIYLLLISSLIVLILAELLLRKVNPWGIDFFHNLPYHMQGMVDHPELGYVHPRSMTYQLGYNSVELNSKGLRDHEVDFKKPPGDNRILALGDSVTFGWGVDQGETFSDRLEPLLRELTNQHWEVINAGVNGYNSQQEATYLRLDGLRFDPDIVILVYVSNDTEPVFDPNETTWRRYPTWPSSLPEALNRLRQLSIFYQVSKLFSRLKERERTKARVLQNGAYKTAHDSIVAQDGWQRSKAALLDINNILKQRNIPFLVATNSGTDMIFMEELDKVGIAVMTLGPAWQEVPSERAHISRVDPHPSAEVHARMAIHLLHELKDRGWLEKRPLQEGFLEEDQSLR